MNVLEAHDIAKSYRGGDGPRARRKKSNKPNSSPPALLTRYVFQALARVAPPPRT